MPSFDSPSVFATLLDRQAGYFRVGPFGIGVPASRAYEPGTNTLVTTWHTPTGWVVVRDALTMGPRTGEDTVTPHTRPPADEDGDHLLVRTIECIDGSVEMELVCEPVFDYGRTAGRVGAARRSPHAPTRAARASRCACRTDMAIGIEGGRARARHTLRAGEMAYCSLSWAEGLASPDSVEAAQARMAATTRFWRSWVDGARLPDHQFREPIARSILAIKGLTYMPTGATVAAATTSLPETPGGERNWDYRYAWMRDATFTLRALHWLNLDWEAEEFMQYVADLEPNADGAMQIMYGIDGRRDLDRVHPRRPLRLRRRAAGADRQRRVRPAPERRLRRRAGLHPAAHPPQPAAVAAAVADRRDAGRVRDTRLARARPGHLGGARRAAAVRLVEAHVLGRDGPGGQARRHPRRQREAGPLARRWPRRSAPTSSSTASTRAASLRQHYETDALDASNLLAAVFGFLPGDDPRLRASVLAIADELTENGYVLRYRTEETDDGLSGKEGTFLICSFWLVSALAVIGELQRGARPDGAPAAQRVTARALRGGARRRHRPPPRELPAGVLAPRADRGGGPHHRRRADRGVRVTHAVPRHPMSAWARPSAGPLVSETRERWRPSNGPGGP